MKKVLVTGSNGFLASRFNEYYKDKYDILALSHKELDITNENQVYDFFKNNNIDIVFHSASISDTGRCQREIELAKNINVDGTINIAKGCELNNSTLIFASSDQLYAGNEEEGPYKEDIILRPNNIYGDTKLEAEKEIKNILEKYYNLRLTWMFSYAERNKRVNTNIITNILNAALKGGKISLATNEYRGISYVYEVIENIEKLMNIPFGDYNFGSENDICTYDIGCSVLENLGLQNRIEDIIIKDTERFKDKKRDLRINNKKLRDNGIYFDNTGEAISRCIKEFNR
ncbi:NAD(P)-dependent oxidoreductase [Clostridium sp. NSJ-6]|uniref:dTDP-4-dehydrorhamnose reductase n=1 Tax=Clostridium hominis TaxID=2763036 RepID=A0ABR7DC83_9CLOT|nr:sugar nucleotide-binding protein [Clostridium hominis]MBC5628963.1 NAD(P)-dependent oxidoreductase [Clostridium hominis]